MNVGKIGTVDLEIDDASSLAVGTKVLGLLTDFRRSGEVDALLTIGKNVKVKICTYGGSGAVCLYRAATIKVSKDLPGGPQEMADTILFELLNWRKGDFNTAAYVALKEGRISLRAAGEKIAKTEGDVTFRHAGMLLKLRSSFGVKLSPFGTRNVEHVGNKTVSDVQREVCISPHDASKPGTDVMSLPSSQMYAYQLVENRDPSEILGPTILRGLSPAPPEWFEVFVTTMAKNIVEQDTRAQVYLKFALLAAKYGTTLKEGYAFSPLMQQLAAKPTLSHGFQQNIHSYILTPEKSRKDKSFPADLSAKLVEVGILP